MPSRPHSQLSQDEEKLLIIAATMLGAVEVFMADPPTTAEQREHWKAGIGEELVRPLILLHRAHHSNYKHI